MARRTRKPAPLALSDVPRACRDAVVTAARERWKKAHDQPSDRMVRMIRFIWMRDDLTWDDRTALHRGTLGACMAAGLIKYKLNEDRWRVTVSGEDLLERDRRRDD